MRTAHEYVEEKKVIRRLQTGDLVSRAVIHNGVVYVSGLTATDRTKGAADQTREILTKIDEVLREAGSDKSKLLTATIWLSDFETKSAVNEIWVEWLPSGAAPARAAMEVELGVGVLVEVMVQAACD